MKIEDDGIDAQHMMKYHIGIIDDKMTIMFILITNVESHGHFNTKSQVNEE